MKRSFDEIVLFARTGLNPRKNFCLGQGKNYYITIKNIHNNKLIVDENTDVINDDALQLIHKRSQIKKGDILFASIGRMGDMYIIEDDPIGWDINESVFALTLDNNIIRSKYFYYIFKNQNILEFLNKNSSGSTFKSIKMNQLKKMVFDVPELFKQDYIIKLLDRVNEIIDLRSRELLALDLCVQDRFVEMFGDPVSNEKNWDICCLSDVCEKLTDGTHFSPESFSEGEFRYVTAKNIKKDGFDFSNISYVKPETHREIYKRCNPEFGDVLYIKDGATTGIAIINSLHDQFTMLSSIALLKQKRDVVNGIFLCGVLNNSSMYHSIRSNMGGAAITRLTIAKIEKINIPVPPLYMQNQFADFVTRVDKSKVVIQESIDKLRLLFDGLMQQYFG